MNRRPPQWVNGALVPADTPAIHADDEGLLLGMAVFDSLLLEDGCLYFAERHLARLAEGARALRLAWPPPWDVRGALDELCAPLVAASAELGYVVRVTYSRGTPRRGPTLVVTARDVVAPPADGVAVTIVPGAKLAADPLERVKSTNRVRNVLAREDALARGAFEALLGSDEGDIVEGTISNVFCLRDGRLLTPGLERGCLAGVTRGLLLEELRAHGLPAGVATLVEDRLTIADLAAAQEVFLTNTSGRLIPVVAVVDRRADLPGPRGEVWRTLRERFAALEAGYRSRPHASR